MKRILVLFLILTSLNATQVRDLDIIQENVVKDTQMSNTIVNQGEVHIENSMVQDSIFGRSGDKNEIKDSVISNSAILQGIVDINDSTVVRSNFYTSNEISNSTIENNSTIIQGTITVTSGIVEDSNIDLVNSINNANINQSSISQSEILIDTSTVQNLTLTNTHSIGDTLGSVTISNSLLTQGRLSIVGNSALANTVITLQSSIENSNIVNSHVDLCSVYISNGATVSGNTITETCSLNNVNIHDASVSMGITTIN